MASELTRHRAGDTHAGLARSGPVRPSLRFDQVVAQRVRDRCLQVLGRVLRGLGGLAAAMRRAYNIRPSLPEPPTGQPVAATLRTPPHTARGPGAAGQFVGLQKLKAKPAIEFGPSSLGLLVDFAPRRLFAVGRGLAVAALDLGDRGLRLLCSRGVRGLRHLCGALVVAIALGLVPVVRLRRLGLEPRPTKRSPLHAHACRPRLAPSLRIRPKPGPCGSLRRNGGEAYDKCVRVCPAN